MIKIGIESEEEGFTVCFLAFFLLIATSIVYIKTYNIEALKHDVCHRCDTKIDLEEKSKLKKEIIELKTDFSKFLKKEKQKLESFGK